MMPPLPLLFALAATLAVTSVSSATDYPLTIDNCGMSLTFSAAPQRVVAIKSTAIEMMLSLGLGDQLVGTGFQDAPLPDQWARELPTLSDKLPSSEVVLGTEPDLIYGGWESNFSAEGAGERRSLDALGLNTYVAPAACRSIAPAKLRFDDVFAQIEELGTIFNIEGRAAELIADQKALLSGIARDNRNLTAVWYSSGTKTPYVGGGTGAPQMMLEALGLENIMGQVEEGWFSASWEAIAESNPDVLVLVDADWNLAEQKQKLLAENPVTRQLDAVINQRYLIVPFAASEAGVRNVAATVDMASQLSEIDFKE